MIMKTILIFFEIIFFSGWQTFAQKTGSWGDQGDGTFRNPILNADYPDADVEKLGDTFYMISSKQHMSPGMVILKSKDLVNWSLVGHVYDNLCWGAEYNWDRMNGYSYGVWAGDLAYHEGVWYCYMIDPHYGLFVSTTKDIEGKWDQPQLMLSHKKVFDDPAVFWDDQTHKAYLICNTGSRKNSTGIQSHFFENRLYEMSWDGKEVLDSGQVVYTGLGAEAAKIYKVKNRWYIFISEWYVKGGAVPGQIATKENDRKQVVLRSKTNSIYGPYEKRIALERGNGIKRSCSQGAMVQAPDSSWWYIHQLVQNTDNPFQGRPQFLEPVSWVDGWPIIGVDIDHDGIGDPVLQYQKPITGHLIRAPETDDDFLEDSLSPQWEWNHSPRDTYWSLSERPGWLRLKASIPLSLKNKGESMDVFWSACNTLSQRIMGTSYGTATAQFDLAGMVPGQKAGFVRFGGTYNLLGIQVDSLGNKKMFYMNHKEDITLGKQIIGNEIYIRSSNNCDKAFFEFSLDNKSFKRFGPTFRLKFGRWTGDRLGFFSWNEDEAKGFVDINWFTYDYDGPKR